MRKRSESNTERTRQFIPAGIIIVSFAVAFVIQLLVPAMFSQTNNAANDALFRIRYMLFGKEAVSPYLVHAVVDDESFRKLGLPAGNGDVYARLVRTLENAAVADIAFDVFFENSDDDARDRTFVDAAKEFGNLYFPAIVFSGTKSPDTDPAPEATDGIVWHVKVIRHGDPFVAQRVLLPSATLVERAAGIGHISCEPDPDGINRRFPLLYKYGNGYIPALALRLICGFYRIGPGDIEVEFGKHILLRHAHAGSIDKDISIPIDERGRMILDLIGPWSDSFTHFPAYRLLEAESDSRLRLRLKDDIEGSLVIVSNTATRNRDYGRGVLDTVYPLSAIHLGIANSILTRTFVRGPGFPWTAVWAIFLAVGLLFTSRKFGPAGFVVSSIVIFLFYMSTSAVWFFTARELVLFFPSAAGSAVAVLAVVFYKSVIESQEKKLLVERAAAALDFEEANRRLRTANETLEETAEAKNRFIENLTHELRTPLTLILSPLESLIGRKKALAETEAGTVLTGMRSNATRLLALIDQLLDLARLKSGKMKLTVRRIDMVRVVTAAVDAVEPIAVRKGIVLVPPRVDQPIVGFVDAAKIERVMFNLLSNAVKYTDPGGKVTVIVRELDPGESSDVMCKSIEVRVCDNGIGIDTTEIDRLFRRFERSGDAIARRIEGTGIGLAIVKELVELHHGRVSATSKKGSGSQFSFVLPLDKEAYAADEIDPDDAAQAVTVSPPVRSVVSTSKTIEAPGTYPPDPVLVVDDEPLLLDHSTVRLAAVGITNIIALDDSEKVMPLLDRRKISVAVIDLSMPRLSGYELLGLIAEHHPETPVIVVTGIATVDSAVRCIREGAYDYFVKPVDFSRLANTVDHCIKQRQLEDAAVGRGRFSRFEELKHPKAFEDKFAFAKQGAMISVFKQIESFAASPHPVLITGESGVGKELIASIIHSLSGQKGDIISENVAGLDNSLFNDALFGHEKGAFTDARNVRKGLIEQAEKGTLFLDEIGDLEMQSQVKLLRFIQEKEYRREGSDIVRKSDARIIVATNADLDRKQADGTFRKDLYYRLSRHHVAIPPLRERREDLMPLVRHFLKKYCEETHAYGEITPPDELRALLGVYDFPGNIRELETMVYNAASRHPGKMLSLSYFREYITEKSGRKTGTDRVSEDTVPSGAFLTLEEMEERHILDAVKKSGGNQNVAAQLLGMSAAALSRRLKSIRQR